MWTAARSWPPIPADARGGKCFEYLWGNFVPLALYLLQAMKTEDFDEQFTAALDEVRGGTSGLELGGFEHAVWSEVAIRGGGGARSTGGFSIPAPALAACGLVAIALGSLIGLTRAQAYSEQASLEVERRYVESIHPVLMSAEHVGHPHR